MSIPTATYRLQFRNGMTFDRAVTLVPYLKKLGISHLYASPIFTATSDSTHGYDVTDANEIDPVLGGREGFDRLSAALKAAGLGLILDIVPNHMAASLENRWWRDVIAYGEKSRYARHFDIDWSRPLTLPFLGDHFDAVLENGELSVQADPETGTPSLAYFDNFYPLAPGTTEGLNLTDNAGIAELHARQPWRLMSWRNAPFELSYRRFFEITGLVGMRVEDPVVFADTHRLILELVHEGMVDGLRVDHVDGLADPKAYLEQLRHHAGPACYLTVEKILGEGEQLPADWPVSGTTGYEFIASLSDALVDSEKTETLFSLYEEVLDRSVDMESELRKAKLLMVDRNFEGEFTRLLALCMAIAETENVTISETPVRAVLRELLVTFPVYRTYGTAQGMTSADRAMLDKVAKAVSASPNAPHPEALQFLVTLLAGEVSEAARVQATELRTRFQQLTGPLMAKSVEDTLFFRQHMDLALNEVGAEPLPRSYSIERFHQDMQTRRACQPDAISTTSTHDTKRGEDTRARLYTLTEAPQVWAEHVIRWREMNQSQVVRIEDGLAPRSGSIWMIYQALAGAWPVTLEPEDKAGLQALEARFLPYVEKALREEKLRTNWDNNNDAYEQAVLGYVSHLLHYEPFLQDFTRSLAPFIRAGLSNTLTQTVIKLMAPGVPDIYQGSEGLNFSLVDPDNRREPDYAALGTMLDDVSDPVLFDDAGLKSGKLKQHITARLLHLRQHKPALFRFGDYLPLTPSGTQARQVVAFARQHEDEAVLVVLPRLMLNADNRGWQSTEVRLPATLAGRTWQNSLTGETVSLTDSIALDNHTHMIVLSG
ncbi:malto-oligosyltrehalose synthase [Yokenella regensburgei]|uniref:malto-oligosyltrehalose synthase n=1 Tax=Yokenella regensburgei TaxID=158877 RepID=UPI003F1436D1